MNSQAIMTPYPEYKATNLPWLPQIPAHWVLVKIRELFTERNQKVSDKEYAPLSVSKDGVVPQISTVAKTDNGDNRKLVKVGDFVINSRSDRKGSSGISAYDGSVSLINLVLKPRNDYNRGYLHYLLKSIPFIEEYYRNGRGIVADLWTTRYSEMKTISIPTPTAAEQEQIVRYLDSMTAKINKLIRAKKKICDLIFEEILLLANEHIDNANLPRYRLKNVIKLVGDQIIREEETLYTPIGVLNRGRGIFHKQQLLGKDLGDSEFFNVSPGDMIFSGQFAWEGAVAIIQETERGCIASHRYPLARAINPELLKLEYLWAFFQTKYGDMLLNIHSHGAAGRNRPLNIMRLLSEAIPIPPLEEQKKIERLFLQLKEAKELAAKYSVQLQEYKNSLIASVVTGQVDIRNIQVEDFDPADLISETDDDSAEDDDQLQEESEE